MVAIGGSVVCECEFEVSLVEVWEESAGAMESGSESDETEEEGAEGKVTVTLLLEGWAEK